ncbi:Hypothetical predicted protein [Pelobates cultripes]|uniref:Uncharacterized protein n=1 Tax=Pelobates cultripes TaxID=61616 RepID=A0AAD1SIM8_PELCU|nr:Hypothetical predicted protein [Pelobates cultripes]
MSFAEIGSLCEKRAEVKIYSQAEVDALLAWFSNSSNFSQSNSMVLYKRFEYLQRKEINYQLHVETLVEYLRVKRIPRGRRLGIKPSFWQYKPKFEENWQRILNKCSLDLIALTIEGLEEDLTKLKQEISITKSRILSTENHKSFTKHSEEIDSILSKHKTDTLNRKLSEFKRDTIDYFDNKVYNWQFHRQRSNAPEGERPFGRNSPANSDSEQSSTGSANTSNFLEQRRPRGGVIRPGESRDDAVNHPPRGYPERERRPWRR